MRSERPSRLTDRLSGASEGRPTTRRPWRTAVQVCYAVLVLGFGALYVSSRWDALRDVATAAQPGWIAASFGLGMAGQLAAMCGFGVVLRAETPTALGQRAVARVFYVSQLSKYIPGSVWPVVATAEMTRRMGLRAVQGARAVIVSMAFAITAGALAGSSIVISYVGHGWVRLLLVVPAALLGVLILRPRLLLGWCRPALERAMPLRMDDVGRWRRAFAWPLLAWLLLGLHCWALVVGVGGPTLRALAPAIGGFALAYVAGMVFLPAPGGLGVREAVLAVTLASCLGGQGGHDSVVVVVLASRVLLALVDFVLAGGILLLTRGSSPGAVAPSGRLHGE